MYLLYYEDLLNLDSTNYHDVEFVNFCVNAEQKNDTVKLIRNLKYAKNGYVEFCEMKEYVSTNNTSTKTFHKNIISQFGNRNYISKDKKVLIIYEVSMCKNNNCGNCVPCFNLEFLNENSDIEILIIIKLGEGGSILLNNLPYSLLQLRIYESTNTYELFNLPFYLQKLELYDSQKVDIEKIKLPIDCSITLLN